MHRTASNAVAVLVSGGLDSAILVGHLLAAGHAVQPIYIRSHLRWEQVEQRWLLRYLAALADQAQLRPLVALEMPLADVYGSHWSTDAAGVPSADSPDEAVYLPGRNPLLLIKAALWCHLHGIDELALAPLASNPFADATVAFFDAFEAMLRQALGAPLRVSRPFGQLTKSQVMQLGRYLPLELTFSCIHPQGDAHCGICNKCAERHTAFQSLNLPDPTHYASRSSVGASD